MTTPGSFFGYGTRLRQGVLTPDPNENYVSWGVTSNSQWQQHSAGTYYWTPPRGLVALSAIWASGGAGGGSGRLDAAGTIRCGGGGGGGGSGGRFHIPMTPDLFGVWTIVVGAGGAGGAAQTGGAAANGVAGLTGGITTISPPVTAFMPDGALIAVSVGGTTASLVGGGGGSGVAGSAGGSVNNQLTGGSGSASIAAGTAASSAPHTQSTQTAGGGGGGGLTALNAQSTAAAPTFWGIMPTQPSMMTAKNLLPAITTASVLNGQTSGRAPTFGGPGYSGQGGGGRAAAAAAGDGANGTAGAGGGGGGGGTTGGGSSGAGGKGGDGFVHFQLWW